MYDVFKTVLILSLFGFGITALLLLLKPITAKRLPARWQYCVWITLLISMVFPAYKLIPKKEAQKLSIVPQNQTVQTTVQPHEETHPDTVVTYDTPIEYREVNISPKISIRLFDLIAYIWGAGVLIFLLVVIISYFRFLYRKSKNSVKISDSKFFYFRKYLVVGNFNCIFVFMAQKPKIAYNDNKRKYENACAPYICDKVKEPYLNFGR